MNALTLGLIAAFCWAVHDITVRKLSQSVPLASALLVVLLVGIIFQASLVVASPEAFAFTCLGFFQAMAAGVAFLIASICLYMAFQRGPVKLVSPIIAAYPILSLVFAASTDSAIRFGHVIAVVIIIAGVGIVAGLSDKSPTEPESLNDSPAFGPTIGLSILSAIGWATTFWLGQMASSSSGELQATLVARVTAFVLLGLILLLFVKQKFPEKKAFVPLAIMGVLDGIALLSVLAAGTKANPEFASIASSMFGLLTVILAVVFLKERMSSLQWVGVLLAFAGIGYLAM